MNRFLRLFIVLLLGPAPVLAQVLPTAPDYALRAGDRVTVQLYTAAGEEVAVVSGERTIDQSGEVFLPYVGTLEVAGLDQSGLRDLLTQRYRAFYEEPVLNISVQLRVSVTGSVGIPGQYFLDPTTTIVDAISRAGGMASELSSVSQFILPADQARVRLVREDKTEILNLRPDEVADTVLAMRIQSGDWIHVPPRPRSRVRDEVQFWGSILSFVTNIVFLVVLIDG